MYLHANAKLGLAGRFILVTAIEEGMTLRAAAAALSVSPATAHRWWHRWREAGEEARRTRSCLRDRSSRPRRSPRQLAPELEEAIYACRRKTGWGRGWSPARLASRTRRSGRCFAGRDLASAASGQGAGEPLRVALPRRSAAHGCLPLRALPATRPPRHRRPLPVLARSERRDASRLRLRHAIVDDHSRLVYVELHDDERAATVTGFVERALAFFAEHGIGVKRLMTDNGFSYVKNRSLRELLARRGIRHLTTGPTGHARTARSSASTRRWPASGPTGSRTAHTDNATRRCHTGSTTTTGTGRTARSETGLQSPAFITSVGRTTSGGD
jgi:hypothetical protein